MVWWINRGRISLQEEFRKCRPKSVVVPETIDAMRQLILQDRHVTYREIRTTLSISGTSLHSKLHEHWTIKKICSHWIPHNFLIAQKKARVDWSEEMLKKNIRSRCFETRLWNRAFMRMNPKVNRSRLYGCYKMSQIQQKMFAHEALPSKWSPVFSEKLDMSQSYR